METCFNPCSRGCFARSRALDPVPIQHEMFQSLFSWMFRPKLGYSAIRHSPRSFNPCSRGCFAQDPHPSGSVPCTTGFNPCSRGCFARRCSCSLRLAYQVSILVLVDVSPEALRVRSSTRRLPSFNPCSRGCFAGSCPIAPTMI